MYNFTQFMVFDRVSEYAPELYEYLVNDWEIERIFATEGWGYTLAALRRRVESWPFRPTLAMRPSSDGRTVLPLAEWAGRQIVLEFSTGTNKRSGESLLQAGWAEPRIEAPGRTEDPHELP